MLVWLGALMGAIVAFGSTATEAGAQSSGSSPTPAPSASTTIPSWSAQVVATEEVIRVVSPSTPPGSDPASTQPATTPPASAVPSTTKGKTKAKKSTRPTTTLVRLLPTTTLADTEGAAQSASSTTATAKKSKTVKSTTTQPVTQVAAKTAAKSATTVVMQLASAIEGAPSSGGANDPMEGALAKLRQCESGGRYDLNTGNGYYGAYQFSPTTWSRLGFPGLPHQAPPSVQDQAARKLQAKSGWGQWPACARKLGLL